MQAMELMITSSVPERIDVAAILVKNGYRLFQHTRKVSNKSKIVLIVDKPEKEE